MDEQIKKYIDSLHYKNIPWHRMITAYGTAENYIKNLEILEKTSIITEWKNSFEIISDFEHQSTMFPPAPFVLIFLVRLFETNIVNTDEFSENTVKFLLKQFIYYAEVCSDAEKMEHNDPIKNFSDLLDEKYLLPEGITEDELDEYFEYPDLLPDDLFYSNYYYSKIVISQILATLNKYEIFKNEKLKLKKILN